MGSSIGPAIDYLVALFGNGFTGTDPYQQPLSVQSLMAIDPEVNIADVWPTEDGSSWVVVGRANLESDAEVAATAQYQVLGRQRITESYSLPCMVRVLGDGPDWGTVRDQTMALFDGITKLVWADPTLNGVLQDGRIALVDQFSLTQYDPSTDDSSSSGAAVGCDVSFALQVENSYIP